VGGGQIFKEALPFAAKLFITKVEGSYAADVFFPEFKSAFYLAHQEPQQVENGITFQFQIWERKS